MFHMSRNRLTPLRVLPGGMQGANRGELNLETGLVDAGSIVLCAAFQNSLIGAVGALNRIPFAFPFVYPVPPFPMQVPGLDQPGAELPAPEFANIAFGTDQDGRIISIELSSETNVPVSVFPLLGLFPPFAFGRDRRFYFGHPTHYLPDTPARNRFTKQTNPDGIHLPAPSLFHPHLILKAEALAASEQKQPAPARAPAVSDAAIATGDQIVIAGGRRENDIRDAVFRIRPGDETWSRGASLPNAVANAAYAMIGSLFHVFGGYDVKGEPCSHTQIYDLETDRWAAGPPLPVALASASAAVLGEKIVVAGGLTPADNDLQISATTFVFDPSSNEWSNVGPMLLPVAEAAATVVSDEMWIVNGVTEQGRAKSRVSTFSLRSRRWGTAPATSDAVRKATIISISGKILRVGGLDDRGCAVRSVAEFDPASGEWGPGFPCVLPTAGAGGVSLGEAGLLIGGFEASSSDDMASIPTQ
jgi:hypothetical protein